MKNSRRTFLHTSVGVFGLLPVSFLGATTLINNDPTAPHATYPTQDPAIVKQVVGAAHARFEVVQELVSARPELAKATYDWGFGDWESALGAASHMGRKDIANFLMEHGARPNIFTFAMLGNMNAVKSMIEDMPGVQGIKGPHGFTLVDHAKIRLRREMLEGEEKTNQEALVDYLTELGDANEQAISKNITKEEQEVYFGKYVFGEGEDAYFEVRLNSRGQLFMSRGEYTGRSLLRVDTHSFAPGGAPSVRVQFDVTDGVAQSLTIHDPIPMVKAVKG